MITSLLPADSDVFSRFGSIVFAVHGNSLTEFKNEDEDDKAITVFAREGWDGIYSHSKKYE